jgi:hypothetical protein
MEDVEVEGLEISSKFKFLLETFKKYDTKRLLVFSSWYDITII